MSYALVAFKRVSLLELKHTKRNSNAFYFIQNIKGVQPATDITVPPLTEIHVSIKSSCMILECYFLVVGD